LGECSSQNYFGNLNFEKLCFSYSFTWHFLNF
jgi:hypothetical protein